MSILKYNTVIMVNNDKQANYKILVVDGESDLVYNFCRCFDGLGVEIFIVSSQQKSPLTSSKYVTKHVYLDHSYQETDIAGFRDIISQYKIDLIYALSDIGILFTGTFISEFSSFATVAILPDPANFKRASNKFLFGEFCLDHSIPVPKTCELKDAEKLLSEGKVIAKPADASGGNGIKVFESKAELLQFKASLSPEAQANYIVQSYLSGFDIDCNIVAKEGKLLAFSVQKGFLEGNHQFAPYEGLEFLYDERVVKLAEQLITALNWSGVGHLDMRYDNHTNELYLIEMNCRYWNSLIASKLVAGVNFPAIHLQASLEKPVQFTGYKRGTFVSAKKFAKAKLKELSKQSDKSIRFRHSNLYLMATDPAYYMAKLYPFF